MLNILLLLTVSLTISRIHQGVRNCNDICLNDTCTSALCAVKFCNTRVFCVGFPEVFLGLTDHFIISSEEASAIITQSLFNYYFHANRDLLLCLLCWKLSSFASTSNTSFFIAVPAKTCMCILCQLSQRFVWEGLVSIILQPRSFTSLYPLACNHKT